MRDDDKSKFDTTVAAVMLAAQAEGDPIAIAAAAAGAATGAVSEEAVAAASLGQLGAALGGALGGPPGAVVGASIGAVLGATKKSSYAPGILPTVGGALIGGALCGPPCAAIGATFFGGWTAHRHSEMVKVIQVGEELKTVIKNIKPEKFTRMDAKGQAVGLPIEDVDNIKSTLSTQLFERYMHCSGSTMFGTQTKEEIKNCLLYSDALKSIISAELR